MIFRNDSAFLRILHTRLWILMNLEYHQCIECVVAVFFSPVSYFFIVYFLP